jgi:cytoskeletal protein CcmA (bactofilin family)
MVGKAALIYVIGFAILLGYVNYNMNHQATQATDASTMYYDYEAAHNLAVAGAHMALAKFLQDSTWSTPFEYSPADIPGSYRVTRVDRTISSVATYNASNGSVISDTISVFVGQRLMTENSFSMFAWMTNNEAGVYWITGDTISGRLHSNSRIYISGTPVFMGLVTTGSTFDTPPGTGPNHGEFLAGWNTKVERIQFPSDLSDLVYASGVYLYPTEIWLSLDSGSPADHDGKAYVRTSDTGPVIDSVFVNAATFDGVIAGQQRVHVQGVLDGRLTVTSQSDIYIDSSITYERDPRAGTSDDMLGLVAENNVVIADNANNYNNCTIQASIFCRRGSFTAENHASTTSGPNGGKRGYIFLLGSIVQNTRGPVGHHINGVLQTGYLKSYTYDNRLSNNLNRPPHYPAFYGWTVPITGWWEGYPKYDFSRLGL